MQAHPGWASSMRAASQAGSKSLISSSRSATAGNGIVSSCMAWVCGKWGGNTRQASGQVEGGQAASVRLVDRVKAGRVEQLGVARGCLQTPAGSALQV